MLTIDSIEYISMKVVVIIASHNYDFKHNPCIIAYLFTIKKAFSLNLARLLTSLSNVIFIISLSLLSIFFSFVCSFLRRNVMNMIIYCMAFFSHLVRWFWWNERERMANSGKHEETNAEKLVDTPFLGYRPHSKLIRISFYRAHVVFCHLVSALQHSDFKLISVQGKRSINFNELFEMRWNQTLTTIKQKQSAGNEKIN